MRTTISLDEDVYDAANQMARASGRRLGDVISELARRGLRGSSPKAVTGRRFPTFDVPSNAPIVTAASLSKFIQDED